MYKIIKNLIPRSAINLVKYNTFIVKSIQKSYYKVFNYPKTLQLHINTECNYNCEYCYSKKDVRRKLNWINIIEQAKKLKVKRIEFLGGEPLLDKNIKLYLKKCDKYKINVAVYTNAMLVNDALIDFIKKLRISLVLAIKFDDQECYEKYTSGNRSYYNNLIRIIKKCRQKNIQVIGHIVVTKKNFKKINDLLQVAKKLDIIPTLERYMPINHKIDKELEITQKAWNEALKEINNFYRKQDKNFLFSSIIKGNTCSCYFDLLSIDVDGFVKPCPFSAEVLGNVNELSLYEIWKLFLKQREEWLKIPGECKNCRNKFICHGGCKTFTFMKKRTYDAKDPFCNGKIIPTVGHCGFVFVK